MISGRVHVNFFEIIFRRAGEWRSLLIALPYLFSGDAAQKVETYSRAEAARRPEHDMAIPSPRLRGRPRATRVSEPGSVQALDRALTILGVLAGGDGTSLSDLSQRTGLAPSSAYRLLQTLAARGFVEFIERDQLWAIGVEAFRTGMAFQRRYSIASVGRGIMSDLVQASGETANIAIFEGGEIVFVAQVESLEPIRAFFRSGERRAAHASGIGKALLAEMPRKAVERVIAERGLERFTPRTHTEPAALFADLARVHVRGWALDDEERNLGMRCIAAAIFNEFGDPVAGLSISGPVARLDDAKIAALGPMVAAGAAEITRLVGGASLPRAGAT
jgi:IclR family acetate operon transcriptional repressor